MKTLLALLTLLSAVPSFATDPPEESCVEDVPNAVIRELDWKEGWEEFALKLSQLIAKNKRLPTNAEFAAKMKITLGAVDEFFDSLGFPRNLPDLVETMRETHYPQLFRDLQGYIARQVRAYVRSHGTVPTMEQMAAHLNMPVTEYRLLFGTEALSSETMSDALEPVRRRILRRYGQLCKARGVTVGLPALAAAFNVTPEQFTESYLGENRMFASFAALKAAAFVEFEGHFAKVIDEALMSPERQEALRVALRTKRRFILVTAVAGAPVNRAFFESLRRQMVEMDAEMIVWPANLQTTGLDPLLLDTPGVHILTNTVELSPFLALNNLKVTAKQLNPLANTERIGARGQTQIFGSPKMHWAVVRTDDNDEHPHMLMSTACLTDPNYHSRRHIGERTDELARRDHVMGALLLERSAGGPSLLQAPMNGTFHIRHLEYIAERRGFFDLNRFYTATGSVEQTPEALVLGDIHSGWMTDQRLMAQLRGVIQTLRPKQIALHDILDGYTISHHEEKKLISMAAKAEAGHLNLAEELNRLIAFLESLAALDSNVALVVAAANHDYWLTRWVQEARFVAQPHNARLGGRMLSSGLSGTRLFEWALTSGALEEHGVRRMDPAVVRRLRFVREGQGHRVGPRHRQVEIGQHGHLSTFRGTNIRAMQHALDGSIFGDTHTVGRRNRAVNTGTSTRHHANYNPGPSAWVQALSIVGVDGGIQTLMFSGNEYHANASQPLPPPDQFYMPGYPNFIPNEPMYGDGVGQVDQWSH